MELLFERFLSEERGEWPDIDLDLPSGDQREEVIQYVYRRYGARGAGMTATVISYRTRSAVREVGQGARPVARAGRPAGQAAARARLVTTSTTSCAAQLAQRRRRSRRRRASRCWSSWCEQLQGLPRHLGQHTGGMVIAAGRLDDVVPLEPATMPGRIVIQWDKDDCADLGLIKVDLLGLGMLAALEEAIPLVRAHDGVDVDLAHLPPDDPARLRHAPARRHDRRLPGREPRADGDAAAHAARALLRPRRRGRDHPARADRGADGAPVSPPARRARAGRPTRIPSLEPILERTLGVPLFQEQLLRIAMAVAGFTGGEAEELRRAMGFKRSVERMSAIEARLRAGMAARGITGATQDEIVHVDHVVRALRLPGVARRQLRADRLRLGVPEGAPPRGLLLRAAERLADGLLPSRHAGEGRASATACASCRST